MHSDVLAAMQEAGARGIPPHSFISQARWEDANEAQRERRRAASAAVLRAALPVLREAVEGLRDGSHETDRVIDRVLDLVEER